MATAVIMPRQGQSVESCVITSWNKKKGDAVKAGDLLFSYETDKSTFDETATTDGTLLAILYEEGDDVPCLENVCVIGAEGEDISGFLKKDDAPAAEAASEPAQTPAAEAAPATAPAETVTAAAPAASASDGSKISPRARILAEKTFADLSRAAATGPNGRIIERDVKALLDAGMTVSPAASAEYKGGAVDGRVTLSDLNAPAKADVSTAPESEYEDVKLPNIRKVIAKSMHASLSEMAQLTLNASFDATKLMAFRASLKASGEALGMGKITLNDMVLFAVAKTIKDYKELNAHFLGDKMRYFRDVNLGVAVDTDRGLMVPTLKCADRMSLCELSAKTKQLIIETQSGSISPDKLQGASFTVTNLGSMGIESFTPVINPPQTGILGVDCITRRVKNVGGQDVFYDAMGLSLTFDHRALDGAPAAKFLKALCLNLENFDLLLAK